MAHSVGTEARSRRRPPGTLTERQKEVLDLVVARYTNAQIAEKLGISLSAAKWHVSEIIGVLGVDTREEAADWWREQNGLSARLRRTAFSCLGLLNYRPLVIAAAATSVALLAAVAIFAMTNDGDEPAPPSVGTTPTSEVSPTGTPNTPVATPDQAPGTFRRLTPGLADPRSIHTETLLADGRVLIVGGNGLSTGDPVLASAEIYDPTTGHFTLAGDLMERRQSHAAALLPDGRVFIAGGTSVDGPLASTELFDPATSMVSAGPQLSVPRLLLSMVVLGDDRVLLVGGGPADAAPFEIYDPVAGTIEPGSGPAIGAYPQLLKLSGGSVLIVADGAAYQFDPTSDTIEALPINVYLPQHAVLLANGLVLITGGPDSTAPVPQTPTMHGFPRPATTLAVLLDPATWTVAAAGPMTFARHLHQAVLLADGRVLVAGGADRTDFGDALSSAEVYDPATNTFTATGDMAGPRVFFTLTALPDGSVLAVGRTNAAQDAISAELYQP